MKGRKIEAKGITLIALVVTIVVLLILAGITIGTLTEDDGVIKEANLAKEQAEKTALEEQIEEAIFIAKQKYGKPTLDQVITEIKKIDTVKDVNKETGVITSTLGYTIEGKLDEYLEKVNPPSGNEAIPGEIVEKSNKEYTSGKETAIIPVGFMIVPGCEDIEEGLVISDNPTDTEQGTDESKYVAEGNQFVWVPVTQNSYQRNTSYVKTSVSESAYTDNGYLPNEIQPDVSQATASATKTKDEVIGEINEQAEKDAVIPKGGFYIARYEASQGENNKPQSKKEVVWNLIGQETAKTNAKTFIDNKYIKSALISGIQWDATMHFISKEARVDGNGKTFDVTTALTEEEFTRHTGTEPASGTNKADKVCNIYDLEGNHAEYTAERHTLDFNNSYSPRGGSYNQNYPSSYRGGGSGEPYTRASFRLVLYVM